MPPEREPPEPASSDVPAKPPEQKPEGGVPDAHAPEQPREPAPPVLRAELQIPQAIADACHADAEEKKRAEKRDRWRLIIEVVGAAVVVIGVVFAGVTLRQLAEQTSIARDAADAAKSAAETAAAQTDLTQKSLRLSRQSHVAAYRAWVLPILDTVEVRFDAKKRGPGKGRWKNWGGGLAKDVRGEFRLVPSLNPPSDPPPPPKFTDDAAAGRGPIPPDGEGQISFGVDPIGDDVMAAVPTGKSTLFLYGVVWYGDAFSDHRESTHCMWYEHLPEKKRPKGSKTEGRWNLCPRWNDAR